MREPLKQEQAVPERAHRQLGLLAQEQEQRTEHWRTREQQAGQERTEAGDTRALEHRRLAAAPPSIEDLTPTVRPECRLGEPLTDLCNEHTQA